MTEQEMYDNAPKILQILTDMIRDVRLNPLKGPPVVLKVVFHSTTIISVILTYKEYSTETVIGTNEWETTPPTKLLREILQIFLDRLYEKYPKAPSEDCAQWESICELRLTV